MPRTARPQRRSQARTGLPGEQRRAPCVRPGSPAALSVHLHVDAHAVIFTRIALRWRHRDDPPTGTRASKGTQRERNGVRFSRHEHERTERGGRHALLSQPGELREQSPSLPSQPARAQMFGELYPGARKKAKGGEKKNNRISKGEKGESKCQQAPLSAATCALGTGNTQLRWAQSTPAPPRGDHGKSLGESWKGGR